MKITEEGFWESSDGQIHYYSHILPLYSPVLLSILSKLSEKDLREFAFEKDTKIKTVSEKMKEYLKYHRDYVFKK